MEDGMVMIMPTPHVTESDTRILRGKKKKKKFDEKTRAPHDLGPAKLPTVHKRMDRKHTIRFQRVEFGQC
jgi:hypothetical protein